VVGVPLAAGLAVAGCASGFHDSAEASRRAQDLVEANIIATQAYQVNMALQSGKGDPKAWSAQGLSTNDLAALIQHQQKLLAGPTKDIVTWVRGQPSTFDPVRDLNPILASPLRASATNLPVNVLSQILGERSGASGIRVRALASLMQMMLDIDRDGSQLQDMFALYTAMGLPVHTAQLGLKETTDAEFLVLARQLSSAMCGSPFATDPMAVRILFRKMWNWGHRHTGERDKTVLARELLQEPEMAALVPKLKALPPQKIAVIGHSYTMNVHWASPSASVPIAAEVLARVNPAVEVRHWQAGGLSAGRADCWKFYEEALAWKPDRVLIVVSVRTPKDTAALEKMVSGFTAAGARVAMFDTLLGDIQLAAGYGFDAKAVAEVASRTGMTLIPVGARIDAAPDRDTFLALDQIHMTEPYHRLLAKAWLEYLAASTTPASPAVASPSQAQSPNQTFNSGT
jgi:hypothetical protein